MTGQQVVEITDEQVEAFWRDGALCLRQVFGDWVEPMRVAIDEALATPGPIAVDTARDDYAPTGVARERSFYIEQGVWNRHPAFERFVTESPALAIGARLLRSARVNLFFDQLFVKEPSSDDQRTPWHQDLPYWPIQGHQVLSVWVTFDPVTLDTGAVQYVRGSHEWGRSFRPSNFGHRHQQFRGLAGETIPDIDADRDSYDILAWDLEPGDCLVHHGMTVHGAYGNSSASRRRRAYSVRWTGDDVVWDPRPDVLEKIPPMTPLPIPLAAGDPLDCDAFPRLWP